MDSTSPLFKYTHEGDLLKGKVTVVSTDILFAFLVILVIIGAFYFYKYVFTTLKALISPTIVISGAGAGTTATTSNFTPTPMTAGHLALQAQVDDRAGHGMAERMTSRKRSHFLGGPEPPVFYETSKPLQSYYSQSSTTASEADMGADASSAADSTERMTSHSRSGNQYMSDEALMKRAL
jgi:hypothetical protein